MPAPVSHAHAARAVEAEPHGDARLRGRAQVAHAAARRARRRARAGRARARASRRAGRRRSRSRIVIRIAVVVGADDEPLAQQRVAERAAVLDRHEEEVRVRRQRLEPDRAQRRRRAARAPRSPASRPAARRARRSRARPRGVDTGAGACRAFSSAATSRDGERVADARAGEPERLRERAQHDHVAVVDQRHRGLAAVLVVRLVDDERPRVGQRPQLAGAGCSAGRRT